MVYPRQGEPLHLCYYLTFLFFTNSQIKYCKSPCNVGFDQTSVMNVCACACVSARVCACASTRDKTIKPTILFSRLSIMPSTASNVLFKPIFPPSPLLHSNYLKILWKLVKRTRAPPPASNDCSDVKEFKSPTARRGHTTPKAK